MDFKALRPKIREIDFETWGKIKFAARSGDAEAQYLMGTRIFSSMGEPEECEEWLKQAAAQRHPEASWELAITEFGGRHWRIRTREGGPISKKRRNLMVKAARLGSAKAQCRWAHYLTEGDYGFAKDLAKARELYLSAGANGSAEAYVNVGWMLVFGEGGPVDQQQGIGLLESVAAGPHTFRAIDAARALADIYSGWGDFAKDEQKARFWRKEEQRLDAKWKSDLTLSDMRESLVDAAEQNDHEKIRELLTAGAAVDGVAAGWTPLMMAANLAHLESCKVLLEHGADSARAVKYAVASRNSRTPALLELLLKFGCPIQSLFREAVWRGRVKDATVVLGAGARLDHPDDRGYPLFLRASQNSSKMIRFLMANGVVPGPLAPNDTYALPYCAYFGYYSRLITMLECKFDQEYLDAALREACLGGNYRCARLLLSSGADPNGEGLATLSAACKHGSLKLVELLLEHAVELDRRDNHEKTGLEWALYFSDGEILDKALEDWPKSEVKYRWTTNPRTGEKAFQIRRRNKTYRWTCCHAEIVTKLRQFVTEGS